MVTAEQFREAFAYDPASGRLVFARDGRNSIAGNRAGSLHKALGYRTVWFAGRNWLEHRVVWLIVHGEWPVGVIDHINGIRSDNRLCNLRAVSQRVNNENRRAAEFSSVSGLLGAHWDEWSKSWRAQITVDGKPHRLGRFKTPQEAHAAYLTAKRQLHEGCTL